MRSTMQDVPLSITSILLHGTTVHHDSEVVTATADGTRSQTYAALGERAARLANARSTSRPTSRSRRWVPSCTPSTSGSSPSN